MINWSPQQDGALCAVADWHAGCVADMRAGRRLSAPIMRVFGYAGTGKTTLARHFASGIRGDVCYASFTGKAALVMERNGCAGASTIHSLIYLVIDGEDGSVRFVRNADSSARDAALIIIDECSMVDEDLGRDLLSFNRPILVLGDPAQLPPVNGAGFFTNSEPDVMLTEIHRQAKDNPIIQLATAARMGERIVHGEYGSSRVVPRGTIEDDEALAASQIIVGRHVTRRAFNTKIRRLLGRESVYPERGDRALCGRNDRKLGLLNGGLFTVLDGHKRRGKKVSMLLQSDDFPGRAPVKVAVRQEFFDGDPAELDWKDLRDTQQFDYGYALTCHKAQGSQWPDVLIYDESGAFREDARRWLYTAISRASERVTLVAG